MRKIITVITAILIFAACDNITVTETAEVTTQDIATASMPFPENQILTEEFYNE